MTIGFVGTGSIAAAVVTGLCTAEEPPARVLVSPRNAARAAALARAFSPVEVAESNQAVVDGAETVVLAVLPQDAAAILGALGFRPEQRVVSLLALTPMAAAKALVAPAEDVVRALPLPSAARRSGPIVVYPSAPWALDLFAPLGTVLAAQSERELNVLWALTALIAPYYTLIAEGAGWAVHAGVAAPTAGRYLSSMFHALAGLAREVEDGDFAPLLAEAATPGGLNEQAVREIGAAGGYAAFLGALDSILARLGEPVHTRGGT